MHIVRKRFHFAIIHEISIVFMRQRDFVFHNKRIWQIKTPWEKDIWTHSNQFAYLIDSFMHYAC